VGDELERELLIAAVAARRLTIALELAARCLRLQREGGSVSAVKGREIDLSHIQLGWGFAPNCPETNEKGDRVTQVPVDKQDPKNTGPITGLPK